MECRCRFCGKQFKGWQPPHVRAHLLGKTNEAKTTLRVAACAGGVLVVKPVLRAWLASRDEGNNKKRAAPPISRGTSDGANAKKLATQTIVSLFNAGTAPLQQLEKAIMCLLAEAALPSHLVDHPAFRNTLAQAAKVPPAVISQVRSRKAFSGEGDVFKSVQQTLRDEMVKHLSGTHHLGNALVMDVCKKLKRAVNNAVAVTLLGLFLAMATDCTGVVKNFQWVMQRVTEVIALPRFQPSEVQLKNIHTMYFFFGLVLDGAGECVKACPAILEAEPLLTFAMLCVPHAWQLIQGDLCTLFRVEIEAGYSFIKFVCSHDVAYRIFMQIPGVRAIAEDRTVRWARVVDMMSVLIKNKDACESFMTDADLKTWLKYSDDNNRTKLLDLHQHLCVSVIFNPSFWGKITGFVATAEKPRAALRITDSRCPNLHLAALAYQTALTDAVSAARASAGAGFHSNLLPAQVESIITKRRPRLMSTPVLAAAAVNPYYFYMDDAAELPAGAQTALTDLLTRYYNARCGVEEGSRRVAAAMVSWVQFKSKTGCFQKGYIQTLARSTEATGPQMLWEAAKGEMGSDDNFPHQDLGAFAVKLCTSVCGQGDSERAHKDYNEGRNKDQTRLKHATAAGKAEMRTSLRTLRQREEAKPLRNLMDAMQKRFTKAKERKAFLDAEEEAAKVEAGRVEAARVEAEQVSAPFVYRVTSPH